MRYIIVHKEYGVYVGNFIGLGFWSRLDDAGQISAPTFPSIDSATNHVRGWECADDLKNDVSFEGVETEQEYIHKDHILNFW